jgi:hypothetical protein
VFCEDARGFGRLQRRVGHGDRRTGPAQVADPATASRPAAVLANAVVVVVVRAVIVALGPFVPLPAARIWSAVVLSAARETIPGVRLNRTSPGHPPLPPPQPHRASDSPPPRSPSATAHPRQQPGSRRRQNSWLTYWRSRCPTVARSAAPRKRRPLQRAVILPLHPEPANTRLRGPTRPISRRSP